MLYVYNVSLAIRSKHVLWLEKCFLPQVQPLYPRVTARVAQRVEAMREEHPRLKVVSWERLKAIVHEDINRLLSEKQLSYICKCLANAGVVGVSSCERSLGRCINNRLDYGLARLKLRKVLALPLNLSLQFSF